MPIELGQVSSAQQPIAVSLGQPRENHERK